MFLCHIHRTIYKKHTYFQCEQLNVTIYINVQSHETSQGGKNGNKSYTFYEKQYHITVSCQELDTFLKFESLTYVNVTIVSEHHDVA